MCAGPLIRATIGARDENSTVSSKPEKLRTRSFESRFRHTQEAYEDAPKATKKQVNSYYDRNPDEDPDKDLTSKEKLYGISKRY